jgi:hypothetical protein
MKMASAECSQETIKCNLLVFQAVETNNVSKLQFAKHNYSEIELVSSLAQCNEEGETLIVIALIAMKGKNVSFIAELVTVLKNCDHTIDEKWQKLVFAIDQLSHHIPIVELIDYLIGDILYKTQNSESIKWLNFLAQVFIKSSSFSRQDKIIALELIGSRLINTVNYSSNFAEFSSGLECWREAMTLRYFPQDGAPLLPKIPAPYVPSEASSFVFGSTVEIMTIEELDILQEDFEHSNLSSDSEVHLSCAMRMKMQAVFVVRRISTQANLGHIYRLYLESLYDFAAVVDFFESKLLINSYLLVLEQMNGFDPKLFSLQSVAIFMNRLENISYFFNYMLTAPLDSTGRREVTYANLFATSKFFSLVAKTFPNSEAFGDFAKHVYCFLFTLHSISPQLTNQEQETLEKFYYDYIRDSPERTTTVLHAAVSYYCSREVLHLGTFKLILRLGADPNAIDKIGRTPLQILVKRRHMREYLPSFQALVDAGTHLDIVADNGETVLSVLKKTLRLDQILSIPVHPYFESLLSTVFPLSCYAARVIRRHGIPFDEDRLPPPLQRFVASHSAKGNNI